MRTVDERQLQRCREGMGGQRQLGRPLDERHDAGPQQRRVLDGANASRSRVHRKDGVGTR